MAKTAGSTPKPSPGLSLDNRSYIVAPGQVTTIPLHLSNPGTSEMRARAGGARRAARLGIRALHQLPPGSR